MRRYTVWHLLDLGPGRVRDRDDTFVGIRVTDWCLGEIVFGGINQAKYSGYLTPIPVWPSVYEQPSDWVL
jgi:hypothetical protein